MAEHLRLTNEVSKYGGVWAGKSDVDKNLNKIRKNKEKKEALSTLIKYHSSFMKSKAPSKLHFNKGTTGESKYIQFDIDTLKMHLKKIIDFNEFTSAIDFEEDVVERGFLTYREEHEREEILKGQKESLALKLIEARIKRKNQKFFNDPTLLLGRRIQYLCREEEEEEREWFDATVGDISLQNDDPKKVEYTVKFMIDIKNDIEWYFPVLADLKKGEVVIMN